MLLGTSESTYFSWKVYPSTNLYCFQPDLTIQKDYLLASTAAFLYRVTPKPMTAAYFQVALSWISFPYFNSLDPAIAG